MLRFLAMLCCALAVIAAGAVAQEAASTPPRPLALAFEKMREGEWSAALEQARKDGQIAEDLIEWHRLRAGRGSAEEVLVFLARNPDWPGLPYLRKKSEAAFESATPEQVRRFFAKDPPRTPQGALILARAAEGEAQISRAQAELVRWWTSQPMQTRQRAAFLQHHEALLKPHHATRFTMLLWRGAHDAAQEMAEMVPEALRKEGTALIALRRDRKDAGKLVNALPKATREGAAVRHQMFLAKMRAGKHDSASTLLITLGAATPHPESRANHRRMLARRAMRAGKLEMSYRLAADHGLTSGSQFADLEWLAGYVALRRGKAEAALQHFQNHGSVVKTPISLGRTHYWQGRAHEALGNSAAAKAAYEEGARYQTSFYGLLSAGQAKLPPDPTLKGEQPESRWQTAPFLSSSVFRAAILLLAIDEQALGERFLTHLTESLPRTQILQLGEMLRQIRAPHIAVMVGKRAASFQGLTIPGPYFALHPLSERPDLRIPPEMALAIARRESEFDGTVVSSAGARGLMQVMPGTAKQMAGELGLPYAPARLTSDPDYNASLGLHYLAKLAQRYNGNPVLVAVAYNAGPTRADHWIKAYGDPRKPNVDVIDWIEHIPFRETRNYAMRITESLPVYRARLGHPTHPIPFPQELKGNSLLPTPSK